MTPSHHPSEALLMQYAKGQLPRGPFTTINAHVGTCLDCSHRVAIAEDAEGLVLAAFDPAPMKPGALAKALADLDTLEPPQSRDLGEDLGVPLPAAATRIGFEPRRWLGPESWVSHLRAPRTDGWLTYLLRVPGGAQFPAHGHSGLEIISLLEGAYFDGRQFTAGDLAENGPDLEHTMVVSPDQACICLISTRGPLVLGRSDRAIGRLLGV